LPDRDNDGVADTLIVAVSGLDVAHGLAFYKGDLFVADTHQVLRYQDADGDHVYEQSDVLVEQLPARGRHSTRTIVFDEVNEMLYVSVGSTCDLCREDDPERATILEFNADGSGIFARGLRNAIGLALHPVTNELWANNNGHDLEGVHLPPEWIDIVRDGGFYGWPVAFGYQVWTDFSIEEYEDALFPLTRQDSLDVEHMQRPAALVPAHLAPMGIHFYTQDLLPPQYRNAAFLAFRGGHSAGVIGYKVMALFSNPDGSDARVADFLTSFSTVIGDNDDVRGKPVGITSDERGSLYITSDERAEMIMKIVPFRIGWHLEGTPTPDAILADTDLELDLAISLSGFDPAGEPPVVTADLSELGGPEELRLAAVGDIHQLTTTLTGITSSGTRTIWFSLEQQTAYDRLLTRFNHQVAVYPGKNLLLADDDIAPGWSTRAINGSELLDFSDGMPVYEGESAVAVRAEEKSLGVSGPSC
jgi:glucose/arabinose dehydrogenase